MKIKSLWVSEYKNLKNIDLKFNSNLVTLLVGQNGLGKSNLIEILAMIFRDIDLLNDETEFKAWSSKYSLGHFEYIIVYECNELDIHITIKDDFFEVKTKKIVEVGEFETLSFSQFLRIKKLLLPKFIIGYYSGENRRIKELIKTHEEKEKYHQRNFFNRKTKPNQELRKIFFAENFHGQLLLVTLALYSNSVKYGKEISKFFSEYLDIGEVQKITIRLNNPRSKSYIHSHKGIDDFYNNFFNTNALVENPFWNLKGKVNELIKILFSYGNEFNKMALYTNEGEDKRRFVKEMIEFYDIEISKIQDNVIEKFPKPINFFDALESSSVIEILSEIEIFIKREGIDEPIKFSNLSEGQQQLIVVIGLILVTGDEDCLFLLDEPDTHINPKWQRNYVELIKEYNKNEEKSHIFLATHSPLLVQAYEGEDLFLFRKDGNNVIIDTENHQIENWRIDQVLVSEYFNLPSARPPKMDDYISLRADILSKRIISPQDVELLKKHENEFAVFPTGETIDDIEAMILIREINQNNKQ